MKIKAIFVFLAIFYISSFSMIVDSVRISCPICNTKFKDLVAKSGTSFGKRLDLKPFGAVATPDPLPVCPICHFPVYMDKVSKQSRDSIKVILQSVLVQYSPDSYGLGFEKRPFLR